MMSVTIARMIIRVSRSTLGVCKRQKGIIGDYESHAIRRCSSQTDKILERLSDKSLLRVSGNEASTFLQGLITNDMKHLDEGAPSMYTLFLNIKGRVMCDAIVYKTEKSDSYYVECDVRIAESLEKHLKMYRVRRKIDIEQTGKNIAVWSMFDPTDCFNDRNTSNENGREKEKVEGMILPCGTINDKASKFVDNIMIYQDPRLADLGVRILAESRIDEHEIMKHVDPAVSLSNREKPVESYRAFRYKLGVGEGICDLAPGKALPLEVNCDYLHGVSFHKGCYIGQELTARTYHTGIVRKRLMPLTLHDRATNKSLAYDEKILDESGKVVGKFRGYSAKYGLGLMRIDESLSARQLSVSDVSVKVSKPAWWPQEFLKETAPVKDRKMKGVADAQLPLEDESSVSKEQQATSSSRQQTSKQVASASETLIFTCSICNLRERYDYKGARPPFARHLLYSEECYVMKDPFSLPNKGEVLLLGADCSKCKRAVCSTCSIYYTRRFCAECATSELRNLPLQLHGKIKGLTKR